MAETKKVNTTEMSRRINDLSKDFNLKNKDVLELLESHGITGKTHTYTLEPDEFSLFFEVLTQSNQIDLTAYFKQYDDAKKAKKEEARKLEEERKAKEEEERRKQKEAMAEQKRKQNPQAQKPQQPQKQRSKTEVRIVDTRGTVNVDLSKYDDKVLKYDSGMPESSGGMMKIKKKNKNADQQNDRNKNAGQQNGKNRFDQQNGKNRNDQQNGKNGKNVKQPVKPKPVQLVIEVPDEITVGELASRMKKTAAEVIKKLMTMGVMASINDVIDYDTAYLVADEFKIVVNKEIVVSLEEQLIDNSEDAEELLQTRAPVVVVMGHVDHGKTSLLDAIRNAHVTAGEAGGITQHIGAYSVHVHDQDITFLDTPGHEAFTAMRARGANMTDIAILVVAADDGIMPQTIEAINHAKAANIPIIVAINKMDRPGANPDRIMTDLTNYNMVPEAWGGDTICVQISALKKQGIDELLDMVLLTAEMQELKANPNRRAQGVVVEARLDKGRGTVATFLVQKGTLHAGDIVIAGTAVGRVRVMTNDKGRTVKEAGPSTPVEITGLSEVPNAGDPFYAVKDEKMARDLAEQRKEEEKASRQESSKVSLDDLFNQIGNGVQDLNIIVKADVQGSAEAVKQSLEKLSNAEVKVNVIHAAVGGITESDVMLANASNAIIIGFNIRPDRTATEAANRDKVEIRTYRIIYECIEEIQAAMKGMLAPEFREKVLGHAEVRQTIHVPNVGTIAGSYITDGKVERNAQIRVLRDSVVIFEDKISSLRRFKDDVKEVADGYECGIGLERFNDIKVGDVLEAFIMEEVAR